MATAGKTLDLLYCGMDEALNVLIVEDEPMIAELLEKMVTYFGAERTWVCADGERAYQTAMRERVDLVFMDLNLAGAMDGIQCARHISQHKKLSIVFATSFCEGSILEEAIDLNTLNYLVKPYSKKDVEITMNLARIARRKRDSLLPTAPMLRPLGRGYTLDMHARLITGPEGAVKMGKKEFELIALLSEQANRAVTVDVIMTRVWQQRRITASTLRETITRLRRKVPGAQIIAVHGTGYRLDVTESG